MLVSVIIPCYNVESYISESVNSVVAQSYKEIEIICIDNNSIDNTWNVLQKLKADFPQIIIEKELTPGAPAARNKGLSMAKGEWIQFLDADDLLLQNKIEHQVSLINISSFLPVIIAGACIKRDVIGREQILVPHNDFSISVFTNQAGNTCSNLWHKASVISAGLWNEKLNSSQETDLMFRIFFIGGDYLLDSSPLTIIRERESGQISQRNPVGRLKQYIEVRLDFLNKLKNNSSTLYSKNSGIYYDFLMVTILMLAKHELKLANNYYKTILPNWKSEGNFGFNRIKVFLIKTMGLKFFLKLQQ